MVIFCLFVFWPILSLVNEKKETLENHGMLVKGHKKQREKHSSVKKKSENVQTIDLISWHVIQAKFPLKLVLFLPEKCVLKLTELSS